MLVLLVFSMSGQKALQKSRFGTYNKEAERMSVLFVYISSDIFATFEVLKKTADHVRQLLKKSHSRKVTIVSVMGKK